MSDDPDVTRRALLAAAAGAAAGTAGCTEISTPADLASADDAGGNLSHLVDGAELGASRDDVTVLDARAGRSYRSERIYGARRPSFDGLTAQRDGAEGVEPDAAELAAAFADAGVRPDDDVVVYGSSVGSRVTRLVFALEHLGHRGDVSVLNGGFDAWTGRIGTGSASYEETDYDADPRADRFVAREWLADRLGSFNEDGPGLIDVRRPEAYLAAAGSAALDEENDRHGHLPGAVNVHWRGNLAGRHLRNATELADLYLARADLDRADTVVVYGRNNVDATNTYVVLRALGFEDVRLYDGGFVEWANVPEGERDRYPVETRTNAVIDTDGDGGGAGGDGDFSCTG